MAKRINDLSQLAALRDTLAQQARDRAAAEKAQRETEARVAKEANLFREAMNGLGGVAPAAPRNRAIHNLILPEPLPVKRREDDRAVMRESVSDDFEADTILHTDDTLSYRRPGIGPDVLRKLRRGEWVIQDQLDLHGSRVDEARELLAQFLKEAKKHGLRCVRVIHGKGLGSAGKQPVLKGKVKNWLAQRDEVIAFCQARPNDGGSGALLVLLKPQSGV